MDDAFTAGIAELTVVLCILLVVAASLEDGGGGVVASPDEVTFHVIVTEKSATIYSRDMKK